jgi:hypothetical protein
VSGDKAEAEAKAEWGGLVGRDAGEVLDRQNVPDGARPPAVNLSLSLSLSLSLEAPPGASPIYCGS